MCRIIVDSTADLREGLREKLRVVPLTVRFGDTEYVDGVTIGHGAIVHGCTIGDNALIGMGAIILNGAVIGKDCIVGAGALVPGGAVFEDGQIIIGSPAKARRAMREEEIESNRRNAEHYIHLAKAELEERPPYV